MCYLWVYNLFNVYILYYADPQNSNETEEVTKHNWKPDCSKVSPVNHELTEQMGNRRCKSVIGRFIANLGECKNCVLSFY